MCYDVAQLQIRAIKRILHDTHDSDKIAELQQEMWDLQEELIKRGEATDYYHAQGFAHPKLMIITSTNPMEGSTASWGLIPHWCKDNETAKKLQNSTINARGETIWEKPSFRDSAKNKRCIIPVNSFYEHHHANGMTYPFNISLKDQEIVYLAGLWSEWADRETGEVIKSCTVVTTQANPLMAIIHNNPKAKEGRMPVILDVEDIEDWINDIDKAKGLIRPYTFEKMNAFPVRRLRGKEAVGNNPVALEEFVYDDLEIELP